MAAVMMRLSRIDRYEGVQIMFGWMSWFEIHVDRSFFKSGKTHWA